MSSQSNLLDALAEDDDTSVVLGLRTVPGDPSSLPSPGTQKQLPLIACCLCALPIVPNAANQCGSCLASQFDLAAVLRNSPEGLHIIQCKRCLRYERVSGTDRAVRYQRCDLESPELLALCLKKIPALNGGAAGSALNVRLRDAGFVWTEPHSKRIKLKVSVTADVVDGKVSVAQRVVVEFVVRTRQCPDCNKEFRKDPWGAVMQLRQRRIDGDCAGVRTVETVLARSSKLREKMLSVDVARSGFDFYFPGQSEAQATATALARFVPLRIRTSRRLVSADPKNNTANVKVTVVADMVPLIRHDLIVLERAGGSAGRLTGRLALVERVTGTARLIDASPPRGAPFASLFDELTADRYWKREKHVRVLLEPRRMVRFVVLDLELCQQRTGGGEDAVYQGPNSRVEKYALADVEVAREADFGVNDESFRCVTHLGHLLQIGDNVLGYDLTAATMEWDPKRCLNSTVIIPDVVLVTKVKGKIEEDGAGADDGAKVARPALSKKAARRKKRGAKKTEKIESGLARMGFGAPEGEDAGHGKPGGVDGGEEADFERELQEAEELLDALTAKDGGKGSTDAKKGSPAPSTDPVGT